MSVSFDLLFLGLRLQLEAEDVFKNKEQIDPEQGSGLFLVVTH
jgi:hypothetical protein